MADEEPLGQLGGGDRCGRDNARNQSHAAAQNQPGRARCPHTAGVAETRVVAAAAESSVGFARRRQRSRKRQE